MRVKAQLIALVLTVGSANAAYAGDTAADTLRAAHDAVALQNETTALRLARKAYRQVTESHPHDTATQALYLNALARIAYAYKTRDALDLLEESLTAHESAFGNAHEDLLPLLLDTADMNKLRGESRRAHALYRQLIDESTRRYGKEGAYHEGLAELRIAEMFYDTNQFAKAQAHTEIALRILQQAEPEPATLMKAQALLLAGKISLEGQDYTAAHSAFTESLQLYERYGEGLDTLNGRDNRHVRALTKRLLLIEHQSGNIKVAEKLAQLYAHRRYWSEGHLIYDPTLHMHWWEGNTVEGTVRRQVAYGATYRITPSGRADNIEVYDTKGIKPDLIQTMLENAYFIPAYEEGEFINYTTRGPLHHVTVNIPAEYATLDTVNAPLGH